ncbi:EAL domain-containing protein [Pseudomonas sp. PDNC002]|uniref:putative bifunctional diguanylate cyclase/phosphodiesterase n=1 Tax=Pseudomonas sp. PDNC002 TaxID=2811422 RepID=UPI001963482F|nr:GGDEF and EAL domain-containing protein [Pseudomonas sp. PDNC002]QRY80645.1 EAL domain-containing protein [Pseudomonas sp. PDNC002]
MSRTPPIEVQPLSDETDLSIDPDGPVGHEALLHELHVHQIELELQNENLLQTQVALEASRDQYLDLYEHAPVGYLTLGLNGQIDAVNLTGAQLIGLPRESLLGRRFSARIAEPDLDHWYRTFVLVCRGFTPQACELTLLREDGSHWYAHLDCTRQGMDNDEVRVSLTDLTERRAIESQLNLAASVFTHAREGIMITDPDGNIVEINEAFSSITGYSRDEVLGRNPRMLGSGMTERERFAELWHCLAEHHYWQGELWNRRRNGEVFVAGQTITAICDPLGGVRNYVSLFTDITELHEHRRQLEYVAHYDPLTHLPNRVLLTQRLQQAMARTQRQNSKLAVAYLDLDGFKSINDLYGHETGDRVLALVAQRMKLTLREGCVLSRLGGDEFVVIIADLEELDDSLPILERLLLIVSQPIPVDSICANVSASIGVSYFPQAADIGGDQLLRQADQAMYQAKLAGKSRFHVFDAQHDLDLRGYNAQLDRIDQALREREFVLFHQPQVNMRTGEVVGTEALIRWQHPEKGLLLPDAFLPLIEGNHLSEVLGEWVIDNALVQLETWLAAGVRIPVSINVGARQLQQPDFVSSLEAHLAAHPSVPPQLLVIEILENSALEEIDGVSRTIRACAAIGVRFALDDFGTGYSSLSYLKRLPVAQLKIDRVFIQGLLDDPEDLSILQAILGLAEAFKCEIIAEGVETTHHGARLLELGCLLGQGAGIARPMPADELLDWYQRWQRRPTWAAAGN